MIARQPCLIYGLHYLDDNQNNILHGQISGVGITLITGERASHASERDTSLYFKTHVISGRRYFTK